MGVIHVDKRRKKQNNPSQEYISFICSLYGDRYDDREEDSSPQGLDWEPGKKASHLSLMAFQRELEDKGIKLSTAKIRKILITGGLWTTERSREVAELYERLGSVEKVATELEVTPELVTMYLPYEKVVYDLEEKSGNAKRAERWREKRLRACNVQFSDLISTQFEREKTTQFEKEGGDADEGNSLQDYRSAEEAGPSG